MIASVAELRFLLLLPVLVIVLFRIFLRLAECAVVLMGMGARYATDLNFFFYGVIGSLSVVISGVIFAPLFAPAPPLTLDEKPEPKVTL
ncbi:putative sodium/glucose cotransporter [Salmonella enterica subsp. enterica serovar Enteritidis str. 13183-1]|nr:putative sodium/glucose cotransporter [Salmonella enterica subsp. enterica serovar Enteritidis str. 13183-1]